MAQPSARPRKYKTKLGDPFSIRLPRNVKAALDKRAKKTGQTRSEIINEAVAEMLRVQVMADRVDDPAMFE